MPETRTISVTREQRDRLRNLADWLDLDRAGAEADDLIALSVAWDAAPPNATSNDDHVSVPRDGAYVFEHLLSYWAGEVERIPVSAQQARTCLVRLRAALGDQP